MYIDIQTNREARARDNDSMHRAHAGVRAYPF